ncbi:MAG: integrase core domain-containing protein [Planctomycetota bacterium]
MPRIQPIRLLLTAIAGWVHREQAATIDHLLEENRVLREQLVKRRLRLTDDQRRRLAAKGVALGRRILDRIATIVTPDTILRWHGRLIATRWTCPAKRRVGRPTILKEIRTLIVTMAKDNPTWGYCRIQGELRKLNHCVARPTIAMTLKDNGIQPSPDRPTSWRTFVRAHHPAIAASDFFTAEVWAARGLVTHYVLFVIDHATRAVEIAGITTNPDAEFMAQVACNLTDAMDGFLRTKRFLILDRDTKFTEQFRHILREAGVTPVSTAVRAPDMNAVAERVVLSITRECLDRLILLGTGHLVRAVDEFVAHYNLERPHQGLENELITKPRPIGVGEVVVSERLGGLLKHYRRSA